MIRTPVLSRMPVVSMMALITVMLIKAIMTCNVRSIHDGRDDRDLSQNFTIYPQQIIPDLKPAKSFGSPTRIFTKISFLFRRNSK
jgi:hypothetical protein